MLRQDWSKHPCPIARSLDVVGDPWVLLVLREALFGATRFEQFRERLQVADNVLTRRLGQMVDAGLLRRSPYRGKQRTHEEYVITDAAADLLPVLDALARWGEQHTQAPERHVEMFFVHRSAGHRSTEMTVCTTCGERLTFEDRAYQRQWAGTAERRS
ncbi:helix-turn-helix domain-containing protein [Kibdelosporangium persicum]|uniref:Helix-turn-helix transcriptional regulator n=1 Tax=Kibdelosporangium persicum TaxID=2698649 RepID=A0ABX2EZV2_9PSEU|nr:helix-turn-helix domain-containing protein [Kibdelosporangium persicum]NRN64310.1 Helix-turn-helix transcriptional regulator [Kibdelosporangium persicum]